MISEKANVIDAAVMHKSGDLKFSPCYIPNVLFHWEPLIHLSAMASLPTAWEGWDRWMTNPKVHLGHKCCDSAHTGLYIVIRLT